MKTFAAVVACALALGATGAQATDGQPLMVGQDNTASTVTRLTSSSAQVLDIYTDAPSHLYGYGPAAITGAALNTGPGVAGFAEGDTRTATGVYGSADYGKGVHGEARFSTGTGVEAESEYGTALNVRGVPRFNRSGIATLSAGETVTVKSKLTFWPLRLTAESFVLATLQTNTPGVWIQAAVPDPETDTFTVYLNKKVKGPVKIAWFVIN